MENSSLTPNLGSNYDSNCGGTADWKMVLMYASFGAAVYFLISGKRAAGMAAAGVGLATVASEYPEKFRQFWEQAPEYLERGQRIVNAAQNLVERLAEQGQTIQSIRHGFRQGSEYRNGGLR